MSEIALAITAIVSLLADLSAANQRAAAGQDMTAADRAALDAANTVKANRLIADIDARIGPDVGEVAK